MRGPSGKTKTRTRWIVLTVRPSKHQKKTNSLHPHMVGMGGDDQSELHWFRFVSLQEFLSILDDNYFHNACFRHEKSLIFLARMYDKTSKGSRPQEWANKIGAHIDMSHYAGHVSFERFFFSKLVRLREKHDTRRDVLRELQQFCIGRINSIEDNKVSPPYGADYFGESAKQRIGYTIETLETLAASTSQPYQFILTALSNPGQASSYLPPDQQATYEDRLDKRIESKNRIESKTTLRTMLEALGEEFTSEEIKTFIRLVTDDSYLADHPGELRSAYNTIYKLHLVLDRRTQNYGKSRDDIDEGLVHGYELLMELDPSSASEIDRNAAMGWDVTLDDPRTQIKAVFAIPILKEKQQAVKDAKQQYDADYDIVETDASAYP